MAHFAEIDKSGLVLRVIVVNNDVIVDGDGAESEAVGIQFCKDHYGHDTSWVQTSYNDNFRKNYASVGFTYRGDIDAFVPPQPYPSWVLSADTARWVAPVPYPQDGAVYAWNEASVSWVKE